MMPRRATTAGFTLLEVLIALAILALIALLGYRAVSSLTGSEARLSTESARWRGLDAAFARLEGDMRLAQPRDVRTGDAREPAWFGGLDAAGNSELRVSRAGPEFSTEPGMAGQRIGYRLRDGALEVLYWPHFDEPAHMVPAAYALAGGITGFEVDYLDSDGGWRTSWPVLGESVVPRAVKIVLTLDGGDTIERWVTLQ
jgi:general secretion pathway protein J